ncbi:MAG: hypothetical protein EPN82_04695 [Bacteroidetes bacterium]|nr:MAG: hypothetical protein EPN82_04695 [Bacteroidota bacterium]
MEHYIFKTITSVIVFVGTGIFIFIFFYVREILLKKRLGGLKKIVTMYSRNIKFARYALFAFLIILFISLTLILIIAKEDELMYRLFGQFVFVISLNYSMMMYSRIIFCIDGFAGAGIPKTYWHEVKGVFWDRDTGQTEWGVKIFIIGMKRPYRAFFKREKKEEIENLFNELIKNIK